jgi:hypothetical protein
MKKKITEQEETLIHNTFGSLSTIILIFIVILHDVNILAKNPKI